MTGFMMQRGRQIILGDVGHGLGDSMYDGTLYVAGKVASLGIDCVEGEWTRRRHRADRAQVLDLRAGLASRAHEVRVREEALQLRQPRAERAKARPLGETYDRRERSFEEVGPRPQQHLHAGGHRRHPHEGRARALPDARLLDVQEDPALGRADLPARHAHALRDRGLPREVRDQDGAGRALREESDRARHPGLHHRHELRRALDRGQDGAGQGRLDGGHGHLLGRGRDDPARARSVDQVVLPDHPEPLRLQPASPDAGRRRGVLHRAGLQGRPRRPPDGPEGHRAGGRDALAARGHRPALARPAPRLARPG